MGTECHSLHGRQNLFQIPLHLISHVENALLTIAPGTQSDTLQNVQ